LELFGAPSVCVVDSRAVIFFQLGLNRVPSLFSDSAQCPDLPEVLCYRVCVISSARPLNSPHLNLATFPHPSSPPFHSTPSYDGGYKQQVRVITTPSHRAIKTMAIANDIPGLEVTIEIDGETAKEYDDPHDAGKEPPKLDVRDLAAGQAQDAQAVLEAQNQRYVVKYIEAKPGAFFQFRIKRAVNFKHRGHHIAYSVMGDNFKVSLRHDTTPNSAWNTVTKGHLAGNPAEGFQTKTFKFAELKIGKKQITA